MDCALKMGSGMNMVNALLLVCLASVICAGCATGNGKKKAEMISEAYEKYHPTYGYRNELPDKNLELDDEGETLWQRPPERVPVYKTPDGPETGNYQRAPVNQQYLGYKKGDDVILEQEMWHKTTNTTTRRPVAQMPDYLQGNYGSTSH